MMLPLTACKLSPVSNLYMEDEVVVEKESYGATQNKSLNLQVPCDNGDIFQNGICINKDLPLSPSIRRFLGKAGENETFPNLIKISGVTDRYDAQKPEHLYKVLPYWRSSIDARLYVGAANNWTNFPQGFPNSIPNMGGQAVMLGYVDPENFDYDNKINNTNPFITSSAIHPFVS